MTVKELYEKYAGRRASCEGNHGIVCGYGDNKAMDLIIAVDKTDNDFECWTEDCCGGTFITHHENEMGYWYVEESDIID